MPGKRISAKERQAPKNRKGFRSPVLWTFIGILAAALIGWQFYDVQATIGNITNRKRSIALDNKCVLLFHARLLNKAPISARLVMLLKDPKGRFTIEGDIGPIKALSLNPLTLPMGLARMEKGKIGEVHFYFAGTDSSSAGRLTILYDGLKVSLLKKEKDRNGYNKRILASFAAGLLIKKSNPGPDGKIRTAVVKYNRNLNKSFFNLVWKSIFTGVKETVGMK
ncbi:MAG: hypothetical protein P4L51_11205 [Puia sp.]|nr:hypothetical protein [Puia sp.]